VRAIIAMRTVEDKLVPAEWTLCHSIAISENLTESLRSAMSCMLSLLSFNSLACYRFSVHPQQKAILVRLLKGEDEQRWFRKLYFR